MKLQEINNKRFELHIQKSIAANLDKLFAEPNADYAADYAEDIKQNIYEKATQLLENYFDNGAKIINTKIDTKYNPDNESLSINIIFHLKKPIEAVEFDLTKPEVMPDGDFERLINGLREELDNIDYGSSNKILQDD